MFTARIENARGDMLTLTGREAEYQVISITGLNPPKASINTAQISAMDGAVFNSSVLNMRNIVLMIRLNGNVEENRLRLYKYFRTKDWCKFYYSNSSLSVAIEGYVESVECNLFSNGELAQISILCPQPYFRSLEQIVKTSAASQGVFTFPFSINADDPIVISFVDEYGGINVYNSSESETGAVIEVDVLSAFSVFRLRNALTGDDLTLNYDFIAGDKILIDTNRGEKTVKMIRDAAITSIFSSVQVGSVFPQIVAGNNQFEYSTDGEINSDKAFLVFRYFNCYRGV